MKTQPQMTVMRVWSTFIEEIGKLQDAERAQLAALTLEMSTASAPEIRALQRRWDAALFRNDGMHAARQLLTQIVHDRGGPGPYPDITVAERPMYGGR